MMNDTTHASRRSRSQRQGLVERGTNRWAWAAHHTITGNVQVEKANYKQAIGCGRVPYSQT